jgi:hypothetical protein
MKLPVPYRRWVVLIGLLAMLSPEAVLAQGGVTATLFFPPGGSGPFKPTDPIPMILQLSGGSATTFAGFAKQDFLGNFLSFSGPGGITSTNATPLKIQPIQCFSRSGVLLPTAIPVVRIENPPFPLEQSAPDVRKVYLLTVPGSYLVKAQIPFVKVTNPALIINDCDQVVPPGPVVNVGSGSGTGLQDVAIVSNSLAFKLCCLTFTGFFSPVGPACPTSGCVAPNMTTNRGNTIPFKFQVFDLKGNVVRTAVATISARFPGNPPLNINLDPGTTPVNQFRLSGDQYIFNVASGQLPGIGIFQFDVAVDDGSTHSVWVELK